MTSSPLEQLALQERTRREILVKSELIPPLPDVVARVLTLLGSTDTEPKDLEEHLHCDPVLVARMLALVNSPFYGIANQVRTIKDAVMVLGFRGLRSLLLASGTAKFLQRDYGCYGHSEKGLWVHSLAVASCAKTLARHLGKGPEAIEEMFVVGLLHDIGKMLLGPYLTERNITIRHGDDTVDVERRAIGIDHSEAGELVVSKWGLSEFVQNTLRSQHKDDVEWTDEIAILQLADALAHRIGIGFEHEESTPTSPMPQHLLDRLGLDDEQWDTVREEMEGAVGAALTQLQGLCS